MSSCQRVADVEGLSKMTYDEINNIILRLKAENKQQQEQIVELSAGLNVFDVMRTHVSSAKEGERDGAIIGLHRTVFELEAEFI